MIYTIEAKSIANDTTKITATPLIKNTAVSGSFTKRTTRLFYSLEYSREAAIVNLSKPKRCGISVYADFETKYNRPVIPNKYTSAYNYTE